MMIFSKATGYGIRAMAYLAARPDGTYCGVKEIAEREAIPTTFLRKILGDLVRHGLVVSSKGIHGGYRLRLRAELITLWEVLLVLEPGCFPDNCMLGCAVANPCCPVEQDWNGIRDQWLASLRKRTIADLARTRSQGVAPRPTGWVELQEAES